MRAVFDTVIYVRALINPQGLCGRLIFEYRRAYDLVVSTQLTTEYHEVLGRPEIVWKYRAAGTRDLNAVMQIISLASTVQSVPTVAVSRDPNDNKFLAAALAGRADFIVSEDFDLLDIGDFEGCRIVSSATFMRILEAQDDSDRP
jgi:putative PIN family toxin of toxin-antitoxin system